MPRAEPRVWLKTARPLRGAVPMRLAVARAERTGRRLWDEAGGERAHALRTMEAVVGGTHQEPALEAHARRHLIEKQAWEALFWQRPSTPRADPATRERLVTVCSGDRGVVLSSCHLGPFFRKSKGLVRLGIEPYLVAGEWFFADPEPGYWGRRLAHWRRSLPQVPLVPARGSFAVLRAVLAAGKTVSIYFDLPGPHATEFLGKQAMLVDGTARLAVQSDALVMPIRAVRDGHALKLQAFEALDPRDFDNADDLHAALAQVHERSILEFPAALADPDTFGWNGCATAASWRRPPREQPQPDAGRAAGEPAAGRPGAG
jgi:hypothetical protein